MTQNRNHNEGAAANDKAGKRAGKPAAAKPGRRRRWPWVLLALALLLLAVGAGLFHWQKWDRFDDAADLQGEWKARATGDTIVFDGRNLKLTDVVSYEYRLDTGEKTISYQFGQLKGSGHYYFSDGRDVLVIVDGSQTLDFPSELGYLPQEVLDDTDAADDITVFDKVSDDTAATPSGTGNGLPSAHANRGEREFVVKEDPSSSSSSGSSRQGASASSRLGSQAASASRGTQDADAAAGGDESAGAYADDGYDADDSPRNAPDGQDYPNSNGDNPAEDAYDESYEGEEDAFGNDGFDDYDGYDAYE